MAKLMTKVQDVKDKYNLTHEKWGPTERNVLIDEAMKELVMWVYNEMLPRSNATLRDKTTRNEMHLKAIKIGLIKE